MNLNNYIITCLKCVITCTYAKCMTKIMKLEGVITVCTVFEQVWFSFLCTKYNLNNEFCILHNILQILLWGSWTQISQKMLHFFLFMSWNTCLDFYPAKAKLDTYHKTLTPKSDLKKSSHAKLIINLSWSSNIFWKSISWIFVSICNVFGCWKSAVLGSCEMTVTSR